MMELYCQPGACSTADHIVLEWSGAPYRVRLMAREEKGSPDYMALNPAGTVPTLVDGDFVLTQNAAIFRYIADQYPGNGQAGDGSVRAQAEATRWIAYVNSDLHPAFKPLFAPQRYGADASCEDRVRDAALANVARILDLAEQQLAGRDWLAGFRSGADAYLYIMLRWATNLGIALKPNLAAFLTRIESDEQVQKVLADEGIAPVGG